MKFLVVLASAALVCAQPPAVDIASQPDSPVASEDGNASQDANVNSRYTVESVRLLNMRRYHLSRSLLDDMQRLVGARFSTDAFQKMAQRMSSELHGYQVVFKLARGTQPGHIRVTFEVKGPENGFDIDMPMGLYNSKQGWSGEGDATIRIGANEFLFGALSDGDSFVERASGIRARYDRVAVGSDRVRIGFEYDAFHDEYNAATLLAVGETEPTAALYRTRQNFEPSASIAIAGPLTWTVGLSFERLQPWTADAPVESSNAVVSSLAYRHEWTDAAQNKHRFDAVYRLRAATTVLGAAYAYTKHVVDVGYHWRRGRQTVDGAFEAGAILGQAPVFDRFVLGTSTALRGWNKFDLDPLGGTRVVYGSAGYGYRMVRTFFDSGAVWDRTRRAEAKQSAGVGVKVEGVLLAVAFPLRNDRVEPVFIAGMNF